MLRRVYLFLFLILFASIILSPPKQALADTGKCKMDFSPKPLVANSNTELEIKTTSTSLPPNRRYYLYAFYKAPGETLIKGNHHLEISASDASNLPNGGVVTKYSDNLITQGWKPGTYTFQFLDTTDGWFGSVYPNEIQCSVEVKVAEKPDTSCQITITDKDNLKPDSPLKVNIKGLPDGSYYAQLFKDKKPAEGKAFLFDSNVPISVPGQPIPTLPPQELNYEFKNKGSGNYTLEVRNDCTSLSIVTGCVPDLKCTPALFEVRDFNAPPKPANEQTGTSDMNSNVHTSNSGQSCDPKSGDRLPDPHDTNYQPDYVTYPGVYTAIGCIPTQPGPLIEGVLRFALAAGGGIGLLTMIAGSLQMITSNGSPDSVKKGREKFQSAVVGLLFIIFSVLLMQVIGIDILALPGFSRQ